MSCQHSWHAYQQAVVTPNSPIAEATGSITAGQEFLDSLYTIGKVAYRKRPDVDKSVTALFDDMRARVGAAPTHSKTGLPKVENRPGYALVQETMTALAEQAPLPKPAADYLLLLGRTRALTGVRATHMPATLRCTTCGQYRSAIRGHTCPITASIPRMQRVLTRRLRVDGGTVYPATALQPLLAAARTGPVALTHPATGERVAASLDSLVGALATGYVPDLWPTTRQVRTRDGGIVVAPGDAESTPPAGMDPARPAPLPLPLPAQDAPPLDREIRAILLTAAEHGCALDPAMPIFDARPDTDEPLAVQSPLAPDSLTAAYPLEPAAAARMRAQVLRGLLAPDHIPALIHTIQVAAIALPDADGTQGDPITLAMVESQLHRGEDHDGWTDRDGRRWRAARAAAPDSADARWGQLHESGDDALWRHINRGGQVRAADAATILATADMTPESYAAWCTAMAPPTGQPDATVQARGQHLPQRLIVAAVRGTPIPWDTLIAPEPRGDAAVPSLAPAAWVVTAQQQAQQQRGQDATAAEAALGSLGADGTAQRLLGELVRRRGVAVRDVPALLDLVTLSHVLDGQTGPIGIAAVQQGVVQQRAGGIDALRTQAAAGDASHAQMRAALAVRIADSGAMAPLRSAQAGEAITAPERTTVLAALGLDDADRAQAWAQQCMRDERIEADLRQYVTTPAAYVERVGEKRFGIMLPSGLAWRATSQEMAEQALIGAYRPLLDAHIAATHTPLRTVIPAAWRATLRTRGADTLPWQEEQG